MTTWANKEQEEYMRELGSIPAAELCACGWYRIGKCASGCNDKSPGVSRADFLEQEPKR